MPPLSILSCSKEYYILMRSEGNQPFGDDERKLELDKDMSEIDCLHKSISKSSLILLVSPRILLSNLLKSILRFMKKNHL